MERLLAVGLMLVAGALFQQLRDPDGYGIFIGVASGALVFLAVSSKRTKTTEPR